MTTILCVRVNAPVDAATILSGTSCQPPLSLHCVSPASVAVAVCVARTAARGTARVFEALLSFFARKREGAACQCAGDTRPTVASVVEG